MELRNAPAINGISSTAAAGEVVMNSQNQVTQVGICPHLACLSVGNSDTVDSGSDSYVAWGRWTSGSANLNFFGLNYSIASNQNQGIHYLVGTPVVSLPTSGTFAYDLLGATKPTDRNGVMAPGTFSGQAVVQFASGQDTKVGLNAQITIGGASYGFATHGGVVQPGQSQISLNSSHAFAVDIAQNMTGSGCASGSNCSINVTGGLFGPQGQRLGIGYTLSPGTTQSKIDGVAVFKR
jgi:hypothetical protein